MVALAVSTKGSERLLRFDNLRNEGIIAAAELGIDREKHELG